jgi:hypothetical protein
LYGVTRGDEKRDKNQSQTNEVDGKEGGKEKRAVADMD